MHSPSKRIALCALLTTLALAVNVLEGSVPLPLPGVRLGLANVFGLAALVLFDARAAFTVTLLRIFLGVLLSANFFAFACSLFGGLAAMATAALLYRRKDLFSLPWISATAATAFNLAQIATVGFILQEPRIVYYLPMLLLTGLISGWGTGFLAEKVCSRLGTQSLSK